MSTVKTTNLQHPSASDVGITLGADGSVVLPQGFTGGIGSNVVQAVKSDTFSTSSTSYVDLTGLSLSITPSSNTAKILIGWSVFFGNDNASRLGRGVITDGSDAVLVQGDAAGSRTRATFGTRTSLSADAMWNMSGLFLWSPASAAAQTIKIRVSAGANTLYVNRSGFFTNDAIEPLPVSVLIAIEVAP